MEEQDLEDNVKKKRSAVDETNYLENTDEGTTAHPQLQKSLSNIDKEYDGIRGHECHILFHFFTLFSISFLIGVVFIHLSLWMNSHCLNTDRSPIGDDTSQDLNICNNQQETGDKNEKNYAEMGSSLNVLKMTLQYTGSYFDYVFYNTSNISTE